MVSVSSVISSASAVGFSGSRSGVPSCFASVAASVAPSASVFVGCASGVDAAARSAFPQAVVFRASSFSAHSFAASLALRSSACVRAVAAASGVWVSFPSAACPASLRPCASPFSGSGSGSWASLALAVFLRVPCLVCLPVGVVFPSWWRSACGVSVVPGPSGFSFFWLSPLPVQPSLF